MEKREEILEEEDPDAEVEEDEEYLAKKFK